PRRGLFRFPQDAPLAGGMETVQLLARYLGAVRASQGRTVTAASRAYASTPLQQRDGASCSGRNGARNRRLLLSAESGLQSIGEAGQTAPHACVPVQQRLGRSPLRRVQLDDSGAINRTPGEWVTIGGPSASSQARRPVSAPLWPRSSPLAVVRCA